MNPGTTESLVDQLAAVSLRLSTFNPFDRSHPDTVLRRMNLELYLRKIADSEPKVLLLGEAPGYQGMRTTGIPFTHCQILLGTNQAAAGPARDTRFRLICQQSCTNGPQP